MAGIVGSVFIKIVENVIHEKERIIKRVSEETEGLRWERDTL